MCDPMDSISLSITYRLPPKVESKLSYRFQSELINHPAPHFLSTILLQPYFRSLIIVAIIIIIIIMN